MLFVSVNHAGYSVNDLMVPSTVSLRAFLCCSAMSLMTLLEKGIGGDIAMFTLVPSAANEGYNDYLQYAWNHLLKGDSSGALSIIY